MSNTLNASSGGLPPHSLRYNPPPQDSGLGAGMDDISGVTASSRNRTEPSQHYNGTGYYVENDEADNSFSDIQTLFLACFATLVPLVFSLLTACAVRILWKKYRRNRDCRTYDGVLHQEESLDHLSGQSSGAPLHAHLLNSDKVKPCDSEFSITAADEIECSGSPVLYSGSSSRTNHASANGSIITMTLKNNHLIVETEERNDGVFVVEVQQGRRESAPGLVTSSAGSYTPAEEVATDQRALVHNPPQRFSDDDKLEEVDEEYYPETTSPKTSPRALQSSSTNTGLSQSTLSITSNDPNPGYQYGNQTGYDLGYHGYPIYSGYINDDPLPTRLPDNKPKITSAVYKQNGRLISMQSIEGGGLSSDKYAKLNNGPAITEDKDDAIQEEQRRLGNMPKDTEEGVIEKVKESILTTGEPKFEKLKNELSPLAEGAVNGKQYENQAFETNEKK